MYSASLSFRCAEMASNATSFILVRHALSQSKLVEALRPAANFLSREILINGGNRRVIEFVHVRDFVWRLNERDLVNDN